MRKGIAFAALDLMGSLLLVIYALINPPVIDARTSIETPGRWIITMRWPYSDNDVDLWLQQPDGRRVFWRNPRSPIAHLEQDDLGIQGDATDFGPNLERLVLRAIAPGEYVVNGHCYACYDLPVRVTVTLWRLQGVDKKSYTVQIVLRHEREEVTAFRFSLDDNGELTDVNRLPASLVHG